MLKLRNRLSFKIVLSFILTAFIAFFLLVWILQVQFRSNFKNYLQEVQKENLKTMAVNISQHYSHQEGWQAIIDDPGIWMNSLRESQIKYRGSSRPGRMMGRREHNQGMMRMFQNRQKPPGMERGLLLYLNLMDRDQQIVIGPHLKGDNIITIPIRLDDQDIGYLNMGMSHHQNNPVELQFLENQLKWLYLIATLALVFSAFISYLLTRHFLAPVAEITHGTRAIIKREFEKRIDVDSTDELGQLAKDFNNMARTLGQFEEQRKRWLSDIAHELRTPLSVLRGEIEAIIDGVRPRDNKEIEVLLEEVKFLSKLVEDLRELSMADSEEINFEWGELNPIAIINENIANFSLEAQQHNLKIIGNLEGPDLLIKGDAQKLKQLFSNIIANAIRYASPGTLVVTNERRGDKVLLIFSDSGPGVPEEDLPKLFERLFRVDRSRSRSLGGTGLGLSISKIIVEQHNGSIDAKNVKDGGLEITIGFPLIL
ncbi:MAG: HAMP domain-containing protein [Proteobacteria bacterium]|nr:HAMP domain-containing protein [Pseudomonadota bacterium]